MNICFDVNECLIDKKEKPIEANVELVKLLSHSHKVFIWSGNGWEYALAKSDDLGLITYIVGY